jgi:putative phage-type endonuclease
MVEQGSPEWRAMRLGKATASRISHIMAKTKSGPSTSRANYLADLVSERLTGEFAASFESEDMRRGKQMEAEARTAYEFFSDNDVELVDFVDHPTIAMSGASPDGLIGTLGLVELKCPKTATHIQTLRTKVVPGNYVLQMQWQMECTNRAWCDFVSYDPRMPADMQLFVRRVDRDEDKLRLIRAEVREFLVDVDEAVADLERMYRADIVPTPPHMLKQALAESVARAS